MSSGLGGAVESRIRQRGSVNVGGYSRTMADCDRTEMSNYERKAWDSLIHEATKNLEEPGRVRK